MVKSERLMPSNSWDGGGKGQVAKPTGRSAPIRQRLAYVALVLVASFYLTRLPFFFLGTHLHELIPSLKILTNNPHGAVVGVIWAIWSIRLPARVMVIWSVIGLILSALMTNQYMTVQPQNPGLWLLTFYFFASVLVVMPLLVILGLKKSDSWGPGIFRNWGNARQ